MTYSVEVSNLEQLRSLYTQAPGLTASELARAIDQSTVVLQASAKRKSPIDSGRLRGSILRQNATQTGNVIQGGVGTDVFYAEWQERGTGIYGPSKEPIKPKNGKAFMFDYKGTVYTVASVKGVKAREYMKGALEDSQARIDAFFEAAAQRITARLAKGAT